MRTSSLLATAILSFTSAVVFAALVLLAPALVIAADTVGPSKATTGRGQAGAEAKPDKKSDKKVRPPQSLWPRPHYADARTRLDDGDEIATLEAMHLALTEVGDGASYVWYRRNGRLSGVVQPTASFKDASGRVCRHVLMLSAGSRTSKAEGVACRQDDHSWRLDG